MIQKSILFLAAVFLLSACSSNFSLMKRRYTKGVYVSSSKKSSVPKQHTEARYVAIHAPEQLQAAVIKSAPEQVTPEQVVTAPTTPYKEAAASRKASTVKSEPVAAAKPVKENAYSSASTVEALHQSAKSKRADSAIKTASDSDARFIVMVILCFFWWLNLISVYMHDDAITLNFWITLLLDFTLIGGIIFSLLVVLDVVDLR